LPPAQKTNKSGTIERAQTFAAQGLIDKAVAEWRKLLSATPNDGNIYNTMGDLHMKANHSGDAISAYLKAADVFNNAGFELKSVALYKKIIKMDSSRIDVYEKIADLNAKRGLIGNALEDYRKIAKHYTQRGDMGGALAVYEKLFDLDPNNADVRIKIAETCKKLGLDQRALEEYKAAHALYEARKMGTQADAVLDQILLIDPRYLDSPPENLKGENASDEAVPDALSPPEDPIEKLTEPPPNEIAPEISGIGTPLAESEPAPEPEPEPEPPPPPSLAEQMEQALAAGDWDAGEPIFSAFSDNPVDSFGYLSRWIGRFLREKKLSEAYAALQRAITVADEYASFSSEIEFLLRDYLTVNPEHLDVCLTLAGRLERHHRDDEAVDLYSKVIATLHEEGNDSEAEAQYKTLKTKFPETLEVQGWAEVFEPPPIELVLESTAPILEPTAFTPDEAPITEIASQEVEIKAVAPPSPVKQQSLSEATLTGYLTEADVYIKYKLYAKAIEHLEMVAGLAPSCVGLHLKLKDLYIQGGHTEKAAVEHLVLAQLYEESGSFDERIAVLEMLDSIDPQGQYHHGTAVADEPAIVKDAVEAADALPNQEAPLPDSPERPDVGESLLSESHDVSQNTDLPQESSSADNTPETSRSHSQIGLHQGEISIETGLGNTLELLQKAGKLTPQYLQTRYALGVAYKEAGLLQKAIREFQGVIGVDFRVGDAHCMIARCYTSDQQIEAAEQALHAGLRDPRSTPEECQALQTELGGLRQERDGGREGSEPSISPIEIDDTGPPTVSVSTEGENSDSHPAMTEEAPKSGSKKKRKKFAYL
jgi:tetratricopeptide (TPR) repeat protein